MPRMLGWSSVRDLKSLATEAGTRVQQTQQSLEQVDGELKSLARLCDDSTGKLAQVKATVLARGESIKASLANVEASSEQSVESVRGKLTSTLQEILDFRQALEKERESSVGQLRSLGDQLSRVESELQALRDGFSSRLAAFSAAVESEIHQLGGPLSELEKVLELTSMARLSRGREELERAAERLTERARSEVVPRITGRVTSLTQRLEAVGGSVSEELVQLVNTLRERSGGHVDQVGHELDAAAAKLVTASSRTTEATRRESQQLAVTSQKIRRKGAGFVGDSQPEHQKLSSVLEIPGLIRAALADEGLSP